MGLSGTRVDTFAEANLATATGINTNGDWEHAFFDVEEVRAGTVVLESRGETFEREIDDSGNYESVTVAIENRGMFAPDEPQDVEVVPFDGHRF